MPHVAPHCVFASVALGEKKRGRTLPAFLNIVAAFESAAIMTLSEAAAPRVCFKHSRAAISPRLPANQSQVSTDFSRTKVNTTLQIVISPAAMTDSQLELLNCCSPILKSSCLNGLSARAEGDPANQHHVEEEEAGTCVGSVDENRKLPCAAAKLQVKTFKTGGEKNRLVRV